MKKIKKIVENTIFYILLFFFISHIVIYFCGIRFYSVATSSMQKVYPVGSIVYDKIVPSKMTIEDLKIGDDVTYLSSSNQYVTHRIIDIDVINQKVLTQGTQNTSSDGWIPFTAIQGKVVFSLPLLGFLYFLVRSVYFWLGLILILGLAFFGKKLYQEIKKTKKVENK
jgi:signal peptidase